MRHENGNDLDAQNSMPSGMKRETLHKGMNKSIFVDPSQKNGKQCESEIKQRRIKQKVERSEMLSKGRSKGV